MKVIYGGPSRARQVPGVGVAERGVPVEVPVPLGLRLVEQRDWSIYVDVREDAPERPKRTRTRKREG